MEMWSRPEIDKVGGEVGERSYGYAARVSEEFGEYYDGYAGISGINQITAEAIGQKIYGGVEGEVRWSATLGRTMERVLGPACSADGSDDRMFSSFELSIHICGFC